MTTLLCPTSTLSTGGHSFDVQDQPDRGGRCHCGTVADDLYLTGTYYYRPEFRAEADALRESQRCHAFGRSTTASERDDARDAGMTGPHCADCTDDAVLGIER